MEEFNKKFDDLVNSLHTDIKPPAASIFIYYIEAFGGRLRYQLRDKDPTNLKAQEVAIKIDRNMQASGKSNLPGFTRGSSSTSKQAELKDKTVSTEKDSSIDPLKELTEVIKAMEANHASQLNAMQNKLIAMERSQSNRFPLGEMEDKNGRKGDLHMIIDLLISWKQQTW